MPPIEPYAPDEPKPLGGYAVLTLVFNSAVAGFVVARVRSGRGLPDRVPMADLALLSVATFKLSRLITKDKVTAFLRSPFTRYQGGAGPAEVSEEPRGEGLQRAVGELLVCPYCIAQWIATGLLAMYVYQPRLTRMVASLFGVITGADYLQQAWSAVDKRA